MAVVTVFPRVLEIMEAVRERSGETGFPFRDGCDGSHCPFRQRCMAERGHGRA